MLMWHESDIKMYIKKPFRKAVLCHGNDWKASFFRGMYLTHNTMDILNQEHVSMMSKRSLLKTDKNSYAKSLYL